MQSVSCDDAAPQEQQLHLMQKELSNLLQAAAYDPGMLTPMLFGDGHATHTYVQDTEALASPGEELSWWQLMVSALRSFSP